MEKFSVTTSKRNSLPYTPFALKIHAKDPTFPTFVQPEQPNDSPVAFQVIDEGEINIFDAERYFNEGQEPKDSRKCSFVNTNLDRIDEQSIPRFSSVSSVDGYGRNYRTRSFHATPTASSEASWNSQTGLLTNPPGSIAVSMKTLHLDGKKKGSSGKWFFGKRCPCSGEKSIQVKDDVSEPKAMLSSNCSSLSSMKQSCKTGECSVFDAADGKAKEIVKNLGIDDRQKMKFVNGSFVKEEEVVPGSNFPKELTRRVVPSGGGFSFPILTPSPVGKLVLDNGKITSDLEDPPRESLEVFRPSGESLLQRKPIERRTLMPFHGDSNNRSYAFPVSPKNRPTNDDDTMSDASSDLFELESFSTQSTLYPMYRRRDSLDEASSYDDGRSYAGNGQGNVHFRRSLDETTTIPSVAPTECYEPSEVSIDWSVTTAEGFDRGSVTNFSISASDYDAIISTHLEPRLPTNATIGGSKRKGLLSCRCEKAVNVAPPLIKYAAEQHRFGTNISVESGRFQAASRLGDINSMHITRASSHMQRPNSAQLPRALTTH